MTLFCHLLDCDDIIIAHLIMRESFSICNPWLLAVH